MNQKTLISDIYKQSGIMYIRFDAEIDNKPNGQKKIGGRRSCVSFSKLEKQPEYKTVSYTHLTLPTIYSV